MDRLRPSLEPGRWNAVAAAAGCGMRVAALLIALIASVAAAEPVPADAAYDRLVAVYLGDRWEDLAAALAAPFAGLDAARAADVAYIRQAAAECRPAWWERAKAGAGFAFKPQIWGRSFAASFDPAAKAAFQARPVGGRMETVLGWPAAQLDDHAEAEHGFSKGALAGLGAWGAIGMADGWNGLGMAAKMDAKPAARDLLARYLDFRGDIAGAYYGTPVARRWELCLACMAYEPKYARMTTVMARQALAAAFVAAVASDPARYPSIPLPPGGDEAAAAAALRQRCEHQPWTLAEDRALREALRVCAVGNGPEVLRRGRIALANGTQVDLDPAADPPQRAKREAWLASRAAAPAPAP